MTLNKIDKKMIEGLEEDLSAVTTQLAQVESDAVKLSSDLIALENKKANTSDVNENLNNISVLQINKNLGKFDETFMSDEFLQKIVGSTPINATPQNLSITSVKVAEKAITPRKTSFIEVSSNLYNQATEIIGFNISSADGSLVVNDSYVTSDFIDIVPNTPMYLFGFVSVAYYDADGAFISRPSLASTGATITTPPNAYRMRAHSQKTSISKPIQVNLGSIKLPYEKYYYKLSNDIELPSDFIKNGTITSEKLTSQSVDERILKDKSVTIKKVDFIKVGSNLFNHETATSGVVILSDGTIANNAPYSISDFIDVLPNTNYRTNAIANISFYDKDYRFIRRITGVNSEAFTTPNDALFVRLNINGSVLAGKRQLNLGDTLLSFEWYLPVFKNVGLSVEMINQVKADEDFKKILNNTGKMMLDIPINGIFSTARDYARFTNFSQTTAAEVYQLYEDLMLEYPEYITKEVLGDDAWGNQIALYKFTPSRPNANVSTKYPKIFLTSGTHGYEHVPGLITYLMFEDICKHWDTSDLLEALRFNVDFLVIPVVNPSGWDDYTRTNINGVDINRNFPEGWAEGTIGTPTYGGTSPLSELEAQYVKSVFDNHADIDIMYDFHNFSGDPTWEHFIWIPTVAGAKVQLMAQMLISRMTRKWRKEYSFIPRDVNWFAGYADSTNGGMIQNHAFARGIKFSATFEVAGRWWIESDVNQSKLPYNTTHKVTAVEALVNWLLINLTELVK